MKITNETLTKLIVQLVDENLSIKEIQNKLPSLYDISKYDAISIYDKIRYLYRFKKGNPEKFTSRFLEHLKDRGIDPSTVNQIWDKTKEFSVQLYPNRNELTEEKMILSVESISNQISSFQFNEPTNYSLTNDNLFILAPSDIHIGKLGFLSNQEVADQVVSSSYKLIKKASISGISKAIVLIGNDVLHIDTPNGTTTKGTPVLPNEEIDVIAEIAFKMYAEIIYHCHKHFKTEVIFVPSNHDYISGYFLAKILEKAFTNLPIKFNVTLTDRKYFKFHKNLIMFYHGHQRFKPSDIPAIILSEATHLMQDVQSIHVYVGHIHHKTESKLDKCNVTIESLRAASQSDRYHTSNGYLAIRAIQGFVHQSKGGQTESYTDYL